MLSILLSVQLQSPIAAINPFLLEKAFELGTMIVKKMLFDGTMFPQNTDLLPKPQPRQCRPQQPRVKPQNVPSKSCMKDTELAQTFARNQALTLNVQLQLTSSQWQHSTCYSSKTPAAYPCLKLLATDSLQERDFIGCVFTQQHIFSNHQWPKPGQSIMVSGQVVDYRSKSNLIWLSNCQVVQ
ncbi:hypothetical protein IQ266_15295 [filamentous cyanobacterium LEGE 11480]|uniref:Uncharacterized protein n=1 Tax=Romeriopsis navalis LEGE 11480 TaxID=2777977 RepID=A0A928Z3W2_9CYAN|nr:hypothetical protein [Romeriopsis navalis]MBE9031099.1 hypothetical protein [Romeriopsis navalis LEGE 11480]